MNTQRRAFTLIELLVVIAIIAILAAILFPVFASAKNAAKKTASLNNMKQIGTAIQLYMGDNDDKLMYRRPRPNLTWKHVTADYIKNTQIYEDTVNPATQEGYDDVAYRADAVNPKFKQGYAYYRAFQTTGTWNDSGNDTVPKNPYQMSQIQQAARAILIMEIKEATPDYGPWMAYMLPTAWDKQKPTGGYFTEYKYSNWGGLKQMREVTNPNLGKVNTDIGMICIFADSHAKLIPMPTTCEVVDGQDMWQFDPAQPNYTIEGSNQNLSWMSRFCDTMKLRLNGQ